MNRHIHRAGPVGSAARSRTSRPNRNVSPSYLSPSLNREPSPAHTAPLQTTRTRFNVPRAPHRRNG